jgi:CheY-like chemotaxis protein/anti-sigma regulatory factor (Ser/Thr protein kinase)
MSSAPGRPKRARTAARSEVDVRPTARSQLTGAMTPEERARVVVALDHDARQPQHAIEMGLRNLRLLVGELEQSGAALDGELLQRLRVALASVQAAARQIVDTQQDLIDAIRLEFDDTRPTSRTIHAGELIARVVRSRRVLTSSVTLHAVPSRLSFAADERWTERVLGNLISNAIWHAGASQILVAARRRGGDIVFEVRDNGRGMAQERVDRIFEPLRAPALAPAGYSAASSGLGLYNVRLYSERMGGAVECRSAPGRGTVFRVRLPGPVETGAPLPLARRRALPDEPRNRMVAVLDDDEQVLRSTERVLAALGIEVYADHDPLRWLSVITELKRMPDLFLLDFQLKGQDCSLEIDIIRRKWAEQRPRIIVVTGHSSHPNLQRIAQRVPVLQKPLSDPQFELILDVLAGRRVLPEAGFL